MASRKPKDEPMTPDEFTADEERRARADRPTLPSWQIAPGLRDYATELLEDHPHLRDANIVYLFNNQDRKRRGKLITGGVLKLNDFQRFMASGMEGVELGAEFVIWVHGPTWDKLTDTRLKSAMLDELFCRVVEHTDTDGNTTLRITDPDYHFESNVQKFGAWRDELQAAQRTFAQLPLPLRTGTDG